MGLYFGDVPGGRHADQPRGRAITTATKRNAWSLPDHAGYAECIYCAHWALHTLEEHKAAAARVPVWYYIRREDGLVQYAGSGDLVESQTLAACISDRPELWHAVEVKEFPRPLTVR